MAPENHHSTSEVGHGINVAHFQELITGCESIGTNYNPVNTRLSVSELNNRLDDAQHKLLDVQQTKSELILEINKRQQTFENLKKRTTKIINALIAITTDQRIIDDARTIVNKIHGNPPKHHEDQNPSDEETHHIVSNSQQSYDNLIQNFSALIELLKVIPDYSPNETDLTIASLETFLQQMKDGNTEVQPKYFAYEAALDARDHELYDPQTGIVETAKKVKSYVKSIFGADSPIFKTINEINFRTFKRS